MFVPPETVDLADKAFTQLQDIVAIIARYAVMENLYQQSGNALSLKLEYQSALLSLCTTILGYFAVAFALGRALSSLDNTTALKNSEFADICERLMEEIRVKDRACHGFRVVVEAKEKSETESEAEIEDVSDDSWEDIDLPSTEDNLIDLDASIV
jgi:hypothetical protein